MPTPIWRNPNSPEAILDDGIARLRRIRGVRRVTCERVDRRPRDTDLLAIVVSFHETWERSESFLPLGESDIPFEAELRDWLRGIERHVREVIRRVEARGFRPPPSGQAMAIDYADDFESRNPSDAHASERAAYRADLINAMYQQMMDSAALSRQMIAMGVIRYDDPERAAQREKADARAADLFKLVAGQEAFDTLNAGNPLPITGSEGTAYALRKKLNYCVERSQDGAKLCATVPGVPLWDHLLGIKLMVEHDEPRFLATANVARPVASGIHYAEIGRQDGMRLHEEYAAQCRERYGRWGPGI